MQWLRMRVSHLWRLLLVEWEVEFLIVRFDADADFAFLIPPYRNSPELKASWIGPTPMSYTNRMMMRKLEERNE